MSAMETFSTTVFSELFDESTTVWFTDNNITNNTYTSFTVDQTVQVIFTVGLSLIVAFGLVGNMLVMFTLLITRSHRQTTTNAFLLNLSIADLLFLIFCVPFHGTLYLLNNWYFGSVMCKLAHVFQSSTAYASVWILTAMSVDRYLAIVHPFRTVGWRNPIQAHKACACVWFLSTVCSLPWLWLYSMDYDEKINKTFCYALWPDPLFDYKQWIFLLIFVCGFAIPTVIIFTMAILVVGSIAGLLARPLLPQTTPGGHQELGRKRKRVAFLVFSLSLVFFICWFPHHVSVMWMNFGSPTWDTAFYVYKIISHIFTYLNSCVNPILYSLISGQFRVKLLRAMNGRQYFSRTVTQYPRAFRSNRASSAESPEKFRLAQSEMRTVKILTGFPLRTKLRFQRSQ